MQQTWLQNTFDFKNHEGTLFYCIVHLQVKSVYVAGEATAFKVTCFQDNLVPLTPENISDLRNNNRFFLLNYLMCTIVFPSYSFLNFFTIRAFVQTIWKALVLHSFDVINNMQLWFLQQVCKLMFVQVAHLKISRWHISDVDELLPRRLHSNDRFT